MELLRDVHERGATICMVTHDPRFEAYARRVVRLFDGTIIDRYCDRWSSSRPGSEAMV